MLSYSGGRALRTKNIRIATGLGGTQGEANLLFGAADQLDPDAVIFAEGSQWARMILGGFSQTVGAVVSNGNMVIQNQEGNGAAFATLTFKSDTVATSINGASIIRDSNVPGQSVLGVIKDGLAPMYLAGGNITFTGGLANNRGLVTLDNTPNFGSNILNQGTLEISVASTSWFFNKQISGSGDVMVTGSNAQAFTWNAAVGGLTNDYSGPTRLFGGILRAEAGAISPNSNLQLHGGLFSMMGEFTRSQGSNPGQVQMSGDIGFVARTLPMTVALGGVATPETVVLGRDISTVGTLTLNDANASANVLFVNPVELAGARLGVRAEGGNAMPTLLAPGNLVKLSVMSGAIGSSVAGGGLIKTGAGTLVLSGANTYTGPTQVAAGVLSARDGVGLPSGSSLVLSGGVLESSGSFVRSLGTGVGEVQLGAILIGQASTTTGSPVITVPSTADLAVGMAVSGTGIPGGATVAAVTGPGTFTLSANATATGVVNLAEGRWGLERREGR
jgi:autotransporter-associated beta strand protein